MPSFLPANLDFEHYGSRFRFWLILSLGAILRLITLNRQSLWLDEAFSYWMANRSWQTLLTYLPHNDTHPPLYYLSLQPMIALGGQEWMLRLPSAIAGIASIGLIFALAREIFDQRTAFIAAFLVAISPFHIWYAQEARMYALVTAFCLAAGLFVIRAIRTNHALDWMLFGLLEGLALLTDVSAVWFVISINTAWLFLLKTQWRSGRTWTWLAAQSLALVVYLPWFPGFLQQLAAPPSWIPAATVTILARTLTDFMGSYPKRSTFESLLSLALLATPMVAAARKLIEEASVKKMQYLMLGCWVVIPLGLAFVASQPYFRVSLLGYSLGQGRSIFLTRNLIVASIPLALLFARGLVWSPRPLMFAVLVGFVAISSISYAQNVLSKSKEDFRTAAQIVREHAEKTDLILFAPAYLKIPFAYYWSRNRSPFMAVNFDVLVNGVIDDSTLQADRESAEELLQGHQRAWLIMNSNNIYRGEELSNFKQVLDRRGRLLESHDVYGVTILLYDTNGF